MFANFDALDTSDLSLQVGAMGFVLDTQMLYVNTQAGWRLVRVSH